jgi:hypothetical protein
VIEFYRTVGGRRFIDHTIPELILSLMKVAVGLDRLSDILEGAQRAVAEDAGAPTEPGGAKG